MKSGFSHVRIRYRTPTQIGLLERFHQTLKIEEVYWRLYDNRICPVDPILAASRPQAMICLGRLHGR
jgi:hypothetical protein